MPNFVETYRATVAPAHCDHLGHMNVQHYFAAVSDGMFAIMIRLGPVPEEIRRISRSGRRSRFPRTFGEPPPFWLDLTHDIDPHPTIYHCIDKDGVVSAVLT